MATSGKGRKWMENGQESYIENFNYIVNVLILGAKTEVN